MYVCPLWYRQCPGQGLVHRRLSVNIGKYMKDINICYDKSIVRANVNSLVAGLWGDQTGLGRGWGDGDT